MLRRYLHFIRSRWGPGTMSSCAGLAHWGFQKLTKHERRDGAFSAPIMERPTRNGAIATFQENKFMILVRYFVASLHFLKNIYSKWRYKREVKREDPNIYP